MAKTPKMTVDLLAIGNAYKLGEYTKKEAESLIQDLLEKETLTYKGKSANKLISGIWSFSIHDAILDHRNDYIDEHPWKTLPGDDRFLSEVRYDKFLIFLDVSSSRFYLREDSAHEYRELKTDLKNKNILVVAKSVSLFEKQSPIFEKVFNVYRTSLEKVGNNSSHLTITPWNYDESDE